MRRFLFAFILFVPFLPFAQVNLWVNQIPDTLYTNREYSVKLNISTSSDFSSLMISISKLDALNYTDIRSENAKIYHYPNVINLLWQGYKKENPQTVNVKFKLKEETGLPSYIELRFVASYLVNGLKGEQLAVYKYFLRRRGNDLLYILEDQ